MSDLTVAIYENVKKANEPRVYEHWHASSIADCPRAHFFKRKGVEALSEAPAGKMIRWEAGHILEATLRPYIAAEFKDLQSNQRYTSEKLQLTGEYDNYVPSLERIIEVKSVHDGAIRMRDKQPRLRDDTPYLHHQMQNHAYVLLLHEHGIKVRDIEYLYCTLGGMLVSYRTPVVKQIMNNVVKRLKLLNEAWESDTPPPCICAETEHPLYNGVMKYCDYRSEYSDDECCSLSLLEQKVSKKG